MSCTHPAKDLLSDFFSNTLPSEKHAEVRRHVRECAECRESLTVMTILKVGAVNSSESESAHIGGDMLAQFVHYSDSLDQSTIARIQRHLSTCEDCSYEYGFLTELISDFERLAKNNLAQQSLFQRIMSALLTPVKIAVRSPVVAYFLLALTLYPASRWIVNEMGTGSSTATTPVLLHESTRSGGNITIVNRDRTSNLIVLRLPLSISNTSVMYTISLLSANGQRALSVPIYYRIDNQIDVAFESNLIDDGTYIARVQLTSPSNPQDTLAHEFSFQLTTK